MENRLFLIGISGSQEKAVIYLTETMISDFLKDEGIDGAFILKDENCRYISGFTGSDSYLFLTPKESYLLTDSRYTEQAKEEAKGFTVVNYAGKLAEKMAELSKKHEVKKLGVEAMLTYDTYLSLHKAMPEVEISISKVDRLRQIKSEEELTLIAEACRISDAGFEKTIPYIKAGVSEASLRTVLECAMLEAGSEGKSFDTIVASGWRSAYPHGTATEKLLEEGDLVTFDFGAIHKGYHSDITRTVAVGEISDRQRFIYDSILGCNEHIESFLKAGYKASDVDKAARDFLKERELSEYFSHSLGHSVGLEIHEGPTLSPRDHTILAAGMTETVEPGVYIPGVGGVRIEDTVVIQEDGISILTKFPKKFLRV